MVAIHNLPCDMFFDEGHDESMHLVEDVIWPPHYVDVRCIESTTFARKATDRGL
jgi:hypothetical protein